MISCKQHNRHKIPAKKPKAVFGLTLVELMVAITISSIAILGIGSVFSGSKRASKLQEELSRIQENGRFAMNYIARTVQNAGYSGCSSGSIKLYNDINTVNIELKFQAGLQGYEANNTEPNNGTIPDLDDYPTLTSASDFSILTSNGTILSNLAVSTFNILKPVPNSDILITSTATDKNISILKPSEDDKFRIKWTSEQNNGCKIIDRNDSSATDNVTGYNNICPDDFIILSDCEKSIAFQVSEMEDKDSNTQVEIKHNFKGTPGNRNAQWGANFKFDTGAEILDVSSKIFYVRKVVRNNVDHGTSLYVKGKSAAPIELVEGVENMQVLYGVDSDYDNIPNRYIPANIVTNFDDVTAVRISLLLRSLNNLSWRTQGRKPYLLGGMTTATATTLNSPDDKRLRRVMTMTIKLRNRALTL